MADTDARIDKLEGRDAEFDTRWMQWVEKHDVRRDEFENRVYDKLDKVTEDINKYIKENSVSSKEIQTLRTLVDRLQKISEYHEKSINTFEVYLKNILDELKTANVPNMKTSLNVVHEKLRKQEDNLKSHTKEFVDFKQEVRNDIDDIHKCITEIKNSVGKYAIKAWVWVFSIVGTGILTLILTKLIPTISGG